MLTFIQCICICVALWGFWCIFKALYIKSGLQDLPGPPRVSFVSGNMTQVYDPYGIPWHLEMPKKYGRVFRVHGLFGDEQVYVTDPTALHHIIIKDQHVYEETSMFIEGNKLMFGNCLLATHGDQHKKQRALLNPVFSIAHMRNLVPIFYQVTYQLRSVLTRQLEDGPKEIDMLHWMSRTALEYIGQGGLGYSFDTFEKEDINEYSRAAKDLFPVLFNFAIARQFLPFIVKLCPPSFRRFLAEHIPNKKFQRLKNIIGVLHSTSVEVFESKKRALKAGDEANQTGKGKDIMSVLLKANASANEKDRLSEEEVLAQMNLLVFAAHDTTSTTLARLLHVLSLYPKAQDKLREEIILARDERSGSDFTYDELVGLPYLDAVIRETLRLYSPFTFMSRTVRQDTSLPVSTPIPIASPKPNGPTHMTSIPLKANTNVIVGIGAANRDHLIWGDDAGDWKPERWLGHDFAEVAKERLPGVFSGIMTFLGGGRACIGFKFSLLEMKLVLTMLLEAYVFEPSGKEIIWRNSQLLTPTTKGRERETPHLPFKVSLVNDAVLKRRI